MTAFNNKFPDIPASFFLFLSFFSFNTIDSPKILFTHGVGLSHLPNLLPKTVILLK